MKLQRWVFATNFFLCLSLIGTVSYVRLGNDANAQYGGGGGGAAPGSAGGGAAFTCSMSNAPEAANSLCVEAVIPPGAPGQGPAAFGPNPLNIAMGATVIWWNNDTVPHTVTADDGSFDSRDIAPGQYFSHTFNSPGNFSYYCAIHGKQSMSGSVNVSSTAATPVACPAPAPGGAAPAPVIVPAPVPTIRPSHSPSPSPSPSRSPSPSPSPSHSPTASPTPHPSGSSTPKPTVTVTKPPGFPGTAISALPPVFQPGG